VERLAIISAAGHELYRHFKQALKGNMFTFVVDRSTTISTTNTKIMVTPSQKSCRGTLQKLRLKTRVQVQFKPNKIEEMIDLNQP